MEQTPPNVFPPLLQSPEAPVFVKLLVPLKLHPLRNSDGLEEVIFPSNEDEGPNVRMPVPESVKLWAVAPVCVNCLSRRVPAEKPPGAIATVKPAARAAVAVVLRLQNKTPWPFVLLTRILLLKVVPGEYEPT